MTAMLPSLESALLSVQSVDVRLGGVLALNQLNLQIRRGESVALVGANGSGKSTSLRLLHGLLSPAQGSALRAPGVRLAMLFQRPYLLRASALTNVRLALWLGGQPWRESRDMAHTALARVGLAALAQRSARMLSGGQQQRLALARAWALRPDVLLLDEPTASLDPHAKREVEDLMAQVLAERPMTLVFASHNLGQVKRLATRVVYLEAGRVMADLPVAQFFDPVVLRSVSEQAHLFLKGELV
jgi:tungstate transport system ATP-binding protein